MAPRSSILPLAVGISYFLSSASAFIAPSPFGFNNAVSSIRQKDLSLMARRGPRYAPQVKEKKPPMNGEITADTLRVVVAASGGKDEPLGVISRAEALAKAKELGGLDLICINPSSDPPVCKICDYSKYRYMQEKKAKEMKKNSKATEIKEVKMSYKIDIHDYGVRTKNASKFLKQGNRVKCTVMFRGREVQHDKLGYELLDKMALDLEELCLREGKAKREGRNLSLILNPRPELLKAVNDNRRSQEKAKKKRKKEEKQLKNAAAVASAEAVASKVDEVAENLNGSDNLGGDEDDLNLESSLESSLDDLFGSDDLTDDLFS